MSLPTQANIATMDYPSRGSAFVQTIAKTGISTETMDYPSRGLAYVVSAFSSSSSLIKTINALANASVKTVVGVAIASVKVIEGLQ